MSETPPDSQGYSSLLALAKTVQVGSNFEVGILRIRGEVKLQEIDKFEQSAAGIGYSTKCHGSLREIPINVHRNQREK